MVKVQDYTIYRFHETKEREIPFKVIWRNKGSVKVGDNILSDNNYVVPVLRVSNTSLKFPGYCHDMRNVYFVYPIRHFLEKVFKQRKDRGFIFKYPQLEQVPLLHSSYYCPVEELMLILFVDYFTGEFDPTLRKVCEHIWSGYGKVAINSYMKRIKDIERLNGILMELMRTLFERAGILPEDIIKRIDVNTKSLGSVLTTLKGQSELNIEDILKVVETSHKLNLDMLSIYAGGRVDNSAQPSIDTYTGSMKYMQHAQYQEIEASNVRGTDNNGPNPALSPGGGVDDGEKVQDS